MDTVELYVGKTSDGYFYNIHPLNYIKSIDRFDNGTHINVLKSRYGLTLSTDYFVNLRIGEYRKYNIGINVDCTGKPTGILYVEEENIPEVAEETVWVGRCGNGLFRWSYSKMVWNDCDKTFRGTSKCSYLLTEYKNDVLRTQGYFDLCPGQQKQYNIKIDGNNVKVVPVDEPYRNINIQEDYLI